MTVLRTLSLPPRVASVPKTLFSDALAHCRFSSHAKNRPPLKIPQELEPHDDVVRTLDCVVESCTSPLEVLVLVLGAQL
ncbi:hypothetical protein EXIGLDRAFT_781686 [Exidia glandulosa HHB12029]|uniref:Uncharacterized protein n=1 Tax=Exidia glandulosa HHB12029 TaxID=1314781 RepID=A0A165B667_EXIGL|nr:hypothetical protein EXIGLDRAFT_781686 [Exidia glandulosa HHB12029]